MLTSETVHELIVRGGAPALFLLLLAGIVGLPIPDETLLTASGFLVRHGELRAGPAALAALGGSICGITISYVLGRTLGFTLIHRYGSWLHLTDDRLARFHGWYQKMGRWSLLVGYFVPGVRHATAIAAGASGLSWRGFAPFAYTGALLWVATFLTAGYLLAEELRRTSALAHRLIAGCAIAVVLVVLVAGAVRWRRRAGTARSSTPRD